MSSRVTAICRGERISLLPVGSVPVATVPAEYLVVEVEGEQLASYVTLDQRKVPLAVAKDRRRGTFVVDAFRSVGYHALSVGPEEFLFCTEDAKLRLDGVLRLLAAIEDAGLSWSSQIIFSDGSSVRHPKVDFAWLVDQLPGVLSAAVEIVDRPLLRTEGKRETGAPCGGRVLNAPSRHLFRSRSSSVLDLSPNGCLELGGARYHPRLVVRSKLIRGLDSIPNRRLKRVLHQCRGLVYATLTSSNASRDAQRQLENLLQRLDDILQHPSLGSITCQDHFVDTPTPEEQIDDRYVTIFRAWHDLQEVLSWNPSREVTPRHAYVGYADQIYQAFVIVMLAKALRAGAVQRSLQSGLAGPSFRSDAFELYYDTEPPKPAFKNWRSGSNRPTMMRPDITIIHRPSGSGLLLDAKYRVEKSGRLPSSAIEEGQVYLQSFGRQAIGICYPGPQPSISLIEGGGYTIAELAIAPFNGLSEFLEEKVCPQLESLMEPLNRDF